MKANLEMASTHMNIKNNANLNDDYQDIMISFDKKQQKNDAANYIFRDEAEDIFNSSHSKPNTQSI